MSGARPMYAHPPVKFPLTEGHRDKPRLSLKNPHKPKRWSHQQELEALKGKMIEISLVNPGVSVDENPWRQVKLLNADQFTIQIEVDSWFVSGQKSVLTYNKSALMGYRAV